MHAHRSFAILTVVLAVASFFLSRVIWPENPDVTGGITPALIPWFIVLGILESIAFGFGISFAIWGRDFIDRFRSSRYLTRAAFISIVWSLVSWWPHDNFHRVIGDDWAKLVYVEYGFHATLIVAAGVIAVWFLRAAGPGSAIKTDKLT